MAAESAARCSSRFHKAHWIVSLARPAEPITSGNAAAAIASTFPRLSRQSFFKEVIKGPTLFRCAWEASKADTVSEAMKQMVNGWGRGRNDPLRDA
jgi:hypothetical protein